MQDRVSQYPGRVKLTPVEGQANTYDLVRADQPTQEGSPLNKATLLTDDVAAAYGKGADAVPTDIFALLSRFHAGMGNEHLWSVASTLEAGEVSQYVNSPREDAYPPEEDDGNTYTYLGQLGGAARIEAGSYTGTGASGQNNPVSLVFRTPPKLLFVFDAKGLIEQTDSGSGKNYHAIGCPAGLTTSYVENALFYAYNSGSNHSYAKKSADGRTVSWYGSSSPVLNTKSTKYLYAAIC